MYSRQIARHPRRIGPRVRRAVDLLLLVVVAPGVMLLLALLATAIKLDSPGPVFISHRRMGKGGRSFNLWKIRTMVKDAEERKKDLMYLNVLPWPDFKIPDDPRVTRVGRWLRKTSLDELPQLWNVVRSDMTLIGPRPCSIPLSDYALWQTERLEATPGLMGDWQATGRNQASFDARCRMDIAQLRSASGESDVALAVRTVRAVLTARDSY